MFGFILSAISLLCVFFSFFFCQWTRLALIPTKAANVKRLSVIFVEATSIICHWYALAGLCLRSLWDFGWINLCDLREIRRWCGERGHCDKRIKEFLTTSQTFRIKNEFIWCLVSVFLAVQVKDWILSHFIKQCFNNKLSQTHGLKCFPFNYDITAKRISWIITKSSRNASKVNWNYFNVDPKINPTGAFYLLSASAPIHSFE